MSCESYNPDGRANSCNSSHVVALGLMLLVLVTMTVRELDARLSGLIGPNTEMRRCGQTAAFNLGETISACGSEGETVGQVRLCGTSASRHISSRSDVTEQHYDFAADCQHWRLLSSAHLRKNRSCSRPHNYCESEGNSVSLSSVGIELGHAGQVTIQAAPTARLLGGSSLLHLILRRFFKIIFQVGTAGIVVLIIMFRKPRIYAEVKWHISRILSLLAAIGIASLLLELTVVTIWWHGRFSLYTGTVGLGTLLVPILTWEVSAAVLTAVFLKLHETNPFRLQARIAQTYSVLKRCAGLLIGVATCALPVAVYLLRDTSFTDRTLLEDLLSYYGMFPWQKLFIFVSFAVLAPLPEELLFRGVIYKSFRARTPTIPAVCLSSLVFAAAHMKLTGSSYTFALGLGSCLLYEYSGSLVPPIIMHMLVSVAFLHSVVW